MNLTFASKVDKQHREAVENLFFLNPRQYRVRDGIVSALEKFGHPRLEEKGDSIYLHIGDKDAQTLFAIDPARGANRPVGVVVFLRSTPAEMVVVHMAVHPDYALQGKFGGQGLGLVLIEKVREIACRIVGVQRIVFFYRQDVVIRL